MIGKKRVNCILAGVLSICMVAGTLTGLNVPVEAADSEPLVVTAGDAPVLKENSYTYWNHTDWGTAVDITFTQTTDFAGIGFRGGVVMDSAVVTGEQNKQGYCDVYLRPNVTVSNENNKFMMYTQMPTYNTDSLANNWGELFRLSSIQITQGENTFSASMSESSSLSIQYLSESGSEWKSLTITPTNNAYFTLGSALSGFCGYLMFDFSQITWDAVTEGAAFDASADYKVSRMTLRNSAVGGACGPFKVGGYYGIDTYIENTTTLTFKNTTKVYTLNDAIKGNDFMKVTQDDGAGKMPEAFSTWNYGSIWGFTSGTDTGVTISQSNNGTVYGGYSYFVKVSSTEAQGYLSSSTTKDVSHKANVKAGTSSKGILMYLELPETGQGSSSMKITGFSDGNAINNTTYKYLTKDGESWTTGTVSADGELVFPDGFKGYVKFYPAINNGFWQMYFNFGLFGGEYGDVIIGGFWSITEDSDSDYVQFTVGGKDTRQKIAKVVLPLKGTMNNPQEPSDTVTVGTNVSSDVIGIDKADGTTPSATVTYSSNSEMFGTHLMRKVDSEAVEENLRVYVKNLWADMDPDVNTFMLWMGVPAGAKISVAGPNLFQGEKNFWGNADGLQYSYLSKDAEAWEYGVISEANEYVMDLPDGFQGYVKFDVSTLTKYRNGWLAEDNTTGFNYDEQYKLNVIQFNFDKLGGNCGPLVLGYVIPLTRDTNSLWAVISNSGTLEDGKQEALSMAALGEQLLSEFRDLLASIGEVTLEDYASVERAIELYQSLSEAQKAQLTDQEKEAYQNMISAFDKYRPSFRGVAAYVADGENMAGFRVGMNLDASAAQNEGYAVSEYGTVVLPNAAFNSNNAKFDSTATGALPYSYTNTGSEETITWNVDYTSKKWSEYDDNFYFRSYVTYTKGDNSITLWNGTVNNQASMSIGEYTVTSEEMTQLGSGFIKKVAFEAPYYVTSIVKAANLFGISVYAGHDYGNINGDYDCSNWWGSKVKIDEEDTALLREYLVGSKSPSIRYMSDLDNDGTISIKDLVRLKRYMNDSNSVVVGDQNYSELLTLLKTTDKTDIYGDKAVNVLGDSISQGRNSGAMYDKSWVSILKNALNDEMNSKNLGYVSLNAEMEGNSEIHELSYETGTWAKWSFWEGTLGQCNYINQTENATLNITVDRQKDGVERNINGFYLYYVGGTGGTFTVSVNDGTPVTINCDDTQDGKFARSQYFDLSSVADQNIKITIVATTAAQTVKIAGISYRNEATGFVVNNYSLSGVALQCYSEAALQNIAKAPIVILTLGTNDVTSYYNTDIEVFQKQLDILVKACKENGSKLIVGDVIWNYQNNSRGFAFKQALKDAANAMGEDGYFVDFNDIPVDKILDSSSDCYHPTEAGHALMAQKMMNFFGLK